MLGTDVVAFATSFLPDREYGVALDNFVKGCSDMLIQNAKGQILTGKRNVHPQPGPCVDAVMLMNEIDWTDASSAQIGGSWGGG